MNAINNKSVIICESPSPTKITLWTNAVTNYRKRLRSSGNSRALIETPYESPLTHFRRSLNSHIRTNNNTCGVSIVSTPPAKKKKTSNKNCKQLFNLDESIVVLDDYRRSPAVENRLENFDSDAEETDIVVVPKKNIEEKAANTPGQKETKVKSVKKTKTPKNKNKPVKQKKEKGSEKKVNNPKSSNDGKSTQSGANSRMVNDENHNGQIMASRTNEGAVATASDVEEIEVIWSSGPNAETANTVIPPQRAKTSPQEPIVVDVRPTMANECFNKYIPNLPTTTWPNHFNGCFSNPAKDSSQNSGKISAKGRLREIVIDGSNVAMGHSRNRTFSEKGLQIVIDYFKSRGHAVKVFLPQSARARGRELIEKLHVEGTVVFTPSRTIAGRNITPYDDRFILEYATQCDGIVVSSDQFRDLWAEKPQWRNTIENRLLTPTFVGDYLMFPEDPLGRGGPQLEQFLRY